LACFDGFDAFVRCAVLASLATVTANCGGVRYALTAADASARLEEAHAAGADRWAQYDYYYAQAHLDEAKVQAMDGSYSDAISLAEIAASHARTALMLARDAQSHRP
jgi:hypothetical protein